ncbi:hypothetical protein EDC94DRAFT_522407, partial [Helicostylum pulchrum]
HQDYIMSRHINTEIDARTNLSTFVEMDIQKPVKGSEYGLLLPEQLEECYIHKTFRRKNCKVKVEEEL